MDDPKKRNNDRYIHIPALVLSFSPMKKLTPRTFTNTGRPDRILKTSRRDPKSNISSLTYQPRLFPR